MTSRYGSIVSVIHPAQLQFSRSLHLLSPDPENSLLMLCWNNNSWICFGWFVSLESLVFCCLLESLGFQRQGSLLENKSKHMTCLKKKKSVMVGEGIFNCLAIKSLLKFLICFSTCKVLPFPNTLKKSSLDSQIF